MPPILGIPSDQWIKIAEYVLILGLIWIAMRFVLRMAVRVFTFGCGAIMVLGLILIALRAIRGY